MRPCDFGFLLSFLNISGATFLWMAITWGQSANVTAMAAVGWLLLPVCAVKSVYNWGRSMRDPSVVYRIPIVRTITRQRSDGSTYNTTQATGRYTTKTLSSREALSRLLVLVCIELIVGLLVILPVRH